MMTIQVPGLFDGGIAFVDIETEKVPTPAGYVMPNGEPLKNRWAATMVGVALDGCLHLSYGGSERTILNAAGNVTRDAVEIVYGATREFDEMILKGRFTNARRAHLPKRGPWPALPYAEQMEWRNVGVSHDFPRDQDVESRDVSRMLRSGEAGWERVAIHCLRDVLELVLAEGDPSITCRRWALKFLRNYRFALRTVRAAR